MDVTNVILDFLKWNTKSYQFPATISREDRAKIHAEARKFGLKSKSIGREPFRQVTITKEELDEYSFVRLELSPGSSQCVTNFLSSHKDYKNETVAEPIKGQRQHAHANWLMCGLPHVPKKVSNNSHQFTRQKLPIWKHRNEIVKSINLNPVVIIGGETGCGKTTQVPQFLMEYAEENDRRCNIICCMPRRIAVIGAANRVSAERGESTGQSVGYVIHLEKSFSAQTVLTYCTTGVLLRALLGGESMLRNVTHIIMDEVHERDKMSDFTLIVVRGWLVKFPHLRLVLMSATLEVEKFSTYFGHFLWVEIPVIKVEGKCHEVSEVYLDQILELLNCQTQNMAVRKPSTNTITTSATTSSRKIDMDESTAADKVLSNLPPPKMDNVNEELINKFIERAMRIGREEDLKILVELITALQDINYQHSDSGLTALMVISAHGNYDLAEILLFSLHASLDVKCRLKKMTALDYANLHGQDDICELIDSYVKIKEVKDEEMRQDDEKSSFVENFNQMKKTYVDSQDAEYKDFIDVNFITEVLLYIHLSTDRGAILVFLPGYENIMAVKQEIFKFQEKFEQRGKVSVFTLHSKLPTGTQKEALLPASGKERKIILSTNIAETSITISDVVYVVDTGKSKQRAYNPETGVYTLQCDWISKACANQRKGRAGRLQTGVVYRLFTYSQYLQMNDFQTPEILREPLQELCLQAKQLAPSDISISQFLANALDPPTYSTTTTAIEHLKIMGALDLKEDLTNLGSRMLEIAAEPHLSKAILYGVLLKCLDPILIIVCSLMQGNIFRLPADPKLKKMATLQRTKFGDKGLSDHLIFARIFECLESEIVAGRWSDWCYEHFVSTESVVQVFGTRNQILGQLKDRGWIYNNRDLKNVNCNSRNWAVVKAALTAGYYPNVARTLRNKAYFETQMDPVVYLHSSSIIKNNSIPKLKSPFLIYHESHNLGSGNTLCNNTVVSPIAVCLFAGPLELPQTATWLIEDEKSGTSNTALCLNNFLEFNIPSETATEILDLRARWGNLVERRLKWPAMTLSPVDEKLLETLVNVLTVEEKTLGFDSTLKLMHFSYLDTKGKIEHWKYKPSKGQNDARLKRT